jgi:hypothetical protein
MIKVTVGEQKTQSEKPFPKLMKATKGTWKDQICFFEKRREGVLIGPREFGYADNFCMEDFTDYNEPITLQNV